METKDKMFLKDDFCRLQNESN